MAAARSRLMASVGCAAVALAISACGSTTSLTLASPSTGAPSTAGRPEASASPSTGPVQVMPVGSGQTGFKCDFRQVGHDVLGEQIGPNTFESKGLLYLCVRATGVDEGFVYVQGYLSGRLPDDGVTLKELTVTLDPASPSEQVTRFDAEISADGTTRDLAVPCTSPTASTPFQIVLTYHLAVRGKADSRGRVRSDPIDVRTACGAS